MASHLTLLPPRSNLRQDVAQDAGGEAAAAGAVAAAVALLGPGGPQSTSTTMILRRRRGPQTRPPLCRRLRRSSLPSRRPIWSAWRGCVAATPTGGLSSEP